MHHHIFDRLGELRSPLACGQVLSGQGQPERGRAAVYAQNLEDGYLTPESSEWRDSLFAYGALLHSAGRDDEAIPRLEEFIERYPDSPDLIPARYFAAESYRRTPVSRASGSTTTRSKPRGLLTISKCSNC